MIVAAIDIGTNSVHLLVGQLCDSYLSTLDSHKVVTRLGAHLSPEGFLEESAIKACVEAVGQMIDIASSYQPEFRIVATHATRVAKNHQTMLDRIKNEHGLDVKVIDGQEEGRLAAIGMIYGLGLAKEQFLGLDIGGGSTEIVVSLSSGGHEFLSLDLGSVILSKSFFSEDVYRKKGLDNLDLYLKEQLLPALAPYRGMKFERSVLCSGIAKALAQMITIEKNRGKVFETTGFPVSHAEITELITTMIGLGRAKAICRRWDLEENRAQIILVGLKILAAISEFFEVDYWQMCAYGLREGIVVDSFNKLGYQVALPKAEDSIAPSLYAFARRFGVDIDQGKRVGLLALAIFDKLASLSAKHEFLGPFYRRILVQAALIHECGRYVSYNRCDRHAYYLVLNAELAELSVGERSLIALLLRYQFKGEAEFRSPDSLGLAASQLARVNALASIMRMAVAASRCRQDWFSSLVISQEEAGLKLCFVSKTKKIPSLDQQRVLRVKDHLAKFLDGSLSVEFVGNEA